MQQIISTPEQLGRILQAARRQQGLTQSELALLLGQSQASVSRIEGSPQGMTLQQLLTLCKRLGLELVVRERGAASSASSPATGPAQGW